MLRLDINTKRTEPTIIRRAQLILVNPPARLLQLRRHLLRTLHLWVQRIRHPDKSNLFDALGVATDRPPNLLVDARLVLLRRQLDKEVAGIHGEEGGEQLGVGDFVGMDRVAVTAGAGVDANVRALGG